MDLFTYLMAKNGHNTSIHEDLFSYLLGKAQGGGGQIKTASGITIYIPDATKTGIVSFMMTKESTQDGEPTPDNPVPVNVVEGYRNLFDKDNATYQKSRYLNDDGVLTNSSTSAYTTSYTSVNPNTTYTIQGSLIGGGYAARVYFYNKDKNWISRTNAISVIPGTFTTPENCYYIQFQYVMSVYDDTTIQIVKGDQELPYVPYGNNYIAWKDVGKNLFDKNNANILNAYFNTGTANTLVSSNSGRTIYISCKPNTTYTISKITSARFYVGYTEETPEINVTVYGRTGNNDLSTPITITTGANATHIVAFIYISNIDTLTLQQILDSIQIEQGTPVTTYEPYKETIVPLPLNGNEIVGIGNYLDEYIVDKSGHCWLNKLIDKKIFDGSENGWVKSGLTYYISGGFPQTLNSLCSHFIKQNNYNWTSNDPSYKGKYSLANVAGIIKFMPTDENITTTTLWKNWLSTQYNNGNPVIVYYALQTPQLIDLNTTVDLKLFKGVNNISNSEDGYMTIEYK